MGTNPRKRKPARRRRVGEPVSARSRRGGPPPEYYIDKREEAARQKGEKALYPNARDLLQRKMFLTSKQSLTDREKTYGTFKPGEERKNYRYYARVRIVYEKDTAQWLDLRLGAHTPKVAREKAATILSAKLKDLASVGYLKSLKGVKRISIEAAFRHKREEPRVPQLKRKKKIYIVKWGRNETPFDSMAAAKKFAKEKAKKGFKVTIIVRESNPGSWGVWL